MTVSLTLLGFIASLSAAIILAEKPASATIEGRLLFPDLKPFNITSRISLNQGEFSTYSQTDGSFKLHSIPPGIHALDVLSTTHHFSQIKIQLVEGDMDNPKCLEYAYPGASKKPASYPVVLKAIATYDYFEPRRGFSVFSMLKNPMFLMMAFSVGLMFLMPKMMEGLEPEERERMKQQMEMQQDPTKMLSQFFGGGEEEAKQRKVKK